MKKILIFIISLPVYFYQYLVSPLMRPSCRHIPTCSQYMLDALKLHGPVRGFFLGINRIVRCRPGGTHGYDPVPRILIKRYKYFGSVIRRWPKSNRLKR
ncbi:MAG TPA: membrane protein insertion efficiency factor YidD [Bacteroidales bacterium]|nr:membrane protein insertion efficiency factor YidD [Bacteroidales bacterium]HQJ21537.1 membrane protein insertion efficiency factor YidD [Bacteroidales bacterium]